MAHATADITTVNYRVSLLAGHHALTADEGAAAGGQDAGASPHELLCAALAACTAITLRMYAQRKEWPLRAVHVDVLMRVEGKASTSDIAFLPNGEFYAVQRTNTEEPLIKYSKDGKELARIGPKGATKDAHCIAFDKRGMWADSTFEDLVQYNDGFRTQLIGTPEQIAERVAAYRKRGVDLILGGFLHFQEEIEYFGSRVLPLVREIENSEQDSVDSPVLASA